VRKVENKKLEGVNMALLEIVTRETAQGYENGVDKGRIDEGKITDAVKKKDVNEMKHMRKNEWVGLMQKNRENRLKNKWSDIGLEVL
jgi:hypothetical protein